MKLIPSVRWKAAFSLPEVAIATAIAAISLVTIVGVLPQGLQSVQRSAQLTTQAKIVRQVLGYLQQSSWGAYTGSSWPNLDSLLNTTWYFDSEGNQLTVNSSAGLAQLSYVVQVAKPGQQGQVYRQASTNQSFHPTLPGAASPSPQSVLVMVQIAPTTNPAFNFTNATSGTYTLQTAVLTRQFYSPN